MTDIITVIHSHRLHLNQKCHVTTTSKGNKLIL